MKNYWQTKNIKTEISDVDTTQGIVSGYFARFNNIDSDGDKIKSGAFLKTINENMERIKHLKNHDPNKMIGKIIDLHEDGSGLHFTTQLSKNTHGSDALIEYQEGLITEHSIGYNVIKSSNSNDQFQELVELKLFEGSAVTWGANPDTPVTGLKGIESTEEVQNELNHLLKYMKVAGLTDDTYASAEIKIKQLQQAIANFKKESPKSANEIAAEVEAKERGNRLINEYFNLLS